MCMYIVYNRDVLRNPFLKEGLCSSLPGRPRIDASTVVISIINIENIDTILKTRVEGQSVKRESSTYRIIYSHVAYRNATFIMSRDDAQLIQRSQDFRNERSYSLTAYHVSTHTYIVVYNYTCTCVVGRMNAREV